MAKKVGKKVKAKKGSSESPKAKVKAKRATVPAADSSTKEKPKAKEVNSDKVDPTAVFIRGLPKGVKDNDLRRWLETNAGPTVTCFAVRDDYGVAKFKAEADAKRCLEQLQGKDFDGSKLRFEAGKKKHGVAPTVGRKLKGAKNSAADAVAAGSAEDANKKNNAGDLRSLTLRGISAKISKEAVQAWIEAQLPGGCGIESLKKSASGSEGPAYTVSFRKEQNARRAMESLQGKTFDGNQVSATFFALDKSRHTEKAGRLILRNLCFEARDKHIRKAFAPLGEIAEIHLPQKAGAAPGQHRGFGFVQFKDANKAQEAIAKLNGTKICSRKVAVDFAVDASLYGSLQREEHLAQTKAQRKEELGADQLKLSAKKDKKKSKKEGDESEAEDDDDDDEEDDGDKPLNAKKELAKMKKLLGDDVEDDDEDEDEDQDEDAKALAKAKKEANKGKKKNDDDDEDDEDEDEDEDEEEEEEDENGNKRSGFDVDDGKTIFVRNVPFDASNEDVRQVFQKFGKVYSVKLVADRTGANAHRGSGFIRFVSAEGATKVLEAEAEVDKKLAEVSAIARKSDRRELPVVDGFGINLKGRRLVVKAAMKPGEADEASKDKKSVKESKKEERKRWMHLLNAGDIEENTPAWNALSTSEQRQRKAFRKERKFRMDNPNFVVDPLRLSIRNMPNFVDAQRLRREIVKYLAESEGDSSVKKKHRQQKAQDAIASATICRDNERRTASNERRSKGFGFVTFKEHETAMKVLQWLNNNPKVLGGNKRPIVDFTIEDKRKLRMQQDLFRKHAHKVVKDGKVPGQGKEGEDAESAKKKLARNVLKKRHKPGVSRGKRQREKKRQAKSDKEARDALKMLLQKSKEEKQVERIAEKFAKQQAKPVHPKRVPDAGLPSKKRARRGAGPGGSLEDDFELRAMQGFRGQR